MTTIPPPPTGTEFTGSQTLGPDSSGINTASLLLTTASGGDAARTSLVVTLSTSPSRAATSSPAASESASSSNSIPIGTVIGICIGVFAGLSALLLLFFYFTSRKRKRTSQARGIGKEAERRKSGRELWVKMEEHDGDGSYEKYAIKRTTMMSAAPSSGTGTTNVGRSITVKSAKSAKTFKSLGYGTNLGLAETFKTPDLPPHLEFTDADIGSGRSFVGNTVRDAPFTRVENPPISWDGETVGEGQSYLSLKHGSGSIQLSNPVSPSMVVSHQTPPAVETRLPQWERAEIVSPEGAEDAYSGISEPRHPYAAARSSQETIRKPKAATQPPSESISKSAQPESANPFKDQNPFEDPAKVLRSVHTPASAGTSDSDSFFTTKSDLTARTGAFAAATATVSHHERMDSNERAMASLIAALNISEEEAKERLSAAVMPTPRQSAASGYSLGVGSIESKDSDAVLDEASFKEFPLPPTDIKRH